MSRAVRSSFSDNPLLRVSRPVSACSRCRAAKIKCDGKLPACTACEKAGREHECSSANDQFARGKERSYVAALELRIEKLQKRLEYAKARKASVVNYMSAEPSPEDRMRKDSLLAIRDVIHQNEARKRENNDVNSLLSELTAMSINPNTRDFEPTSNMTFARLVLAATAHEPLPDARGWRLPLRQHALALTSYYMDNIYCLYPFFNETSLYNTIDQIYQQQADSVKTSDLWLTYMVLAVGSMSLCRTVDDEHYTNGLYLASTALQHADGALMPGHAGQIQSLMLLTQFAMLDPTHFDSWTLIGFASRAVIDVGYHQDPPVGSTQDKDALDMRRKIFYCVYSLDRSISMAHARAFSFSDNAMNVAWPRPSSFSRQASITGKILSGSEPAFCLFQLRLAQSNWYQALHQSQSPPPPDTASFIWRVCREMNEWATNLPNQLPPEMREHFDLEVRYSYVYCFVPATKIHHAADYSRVLIFEHAIAYLNKMFEVAQLPNPAAFYNYHDTLRVLFMANHLVAVLRDAEHIILDGAPMNPLPPPGPDPTCAPPPLPQIDSAARMLGNVERSFQCLEKTASTLAMYGQRWNDAKSLRQQFDLIVDETNARLRMRRQMQQKSPQAHGLSGQAAGPGSAGHWTGAGMDSGGMIPGGGSNDARFALPPNLKFEP